MKESITHLHVLCEDWKRELNFFADEIPMLRKRLEEVVSKNTDKEILSQVEHFENKFKLMALNTDELLHDVNLKNQSLSAQAVAKANYINVKMIESDQNLEDLMSITSQDFYNTKKSYYNFLSKVM
jgi:hypothetical protein